MPTNFLFFESIRKQLLNQGYNSIVIVNKHEGPEQCFLSKKQFLPDILLETNFLMVPLTDSYAVDIIKKHFDPENLLTPCNIDRNNTKVRIL